MVPIRRRLGAPSCFPMSKTAKKSQALEYERIPPRPKTPFGDIGDELAYVLPMLFFLGFVFLGGQFKSTYPSMYVSRTLIVPVMLALFWKHYTTIRWDFWWL